MSSPLKTLCMRLPAASPSTIVRCCPQASFASGAAATRRPSCLASRMKQQQQTLTFTKSFSSAKPSLSSPSSSTRASLSSPSIAARSPACSPTLRSYSSAAAAATASSPNGAANTSTSAALNWDSFFKLRLRRRRIQLLFSVTTGFLGGAAGAIALAEGIAEPLVAQIPLDPFVTLGIITMACVGMGWLIGPTLGNQAFYLVNRRWKSQMMQKESEFFTRIKKHRVDPTNSSAGNPVPDFYGEKIQSVSGYRRWLKDQRAFNKKKTASFV